MYQHEGIALVEENGYFLFIDKEGSQVFNKTFDDAHSFFGGLATVEENGLWGFINRNGEFAISPQFSETHNFSEKFAVVKKDGQWGVIDILGTTVIDFEFDNVKDFHEGYCIVMKDDKWGVINNLGEVVVDCKFDEIKNFSEGYAAVSQDGKWGYINDSGDLCIDLKYDDASNFKEGKAAVKVSDYKERMEAWAYIDPKDKVVIDFYPYDVAGDQMFLVGEFNDGLAFVTKTLISIIDSEGNNVYLFGSSKFFISDTSYNKDLDTIIAYTYIDENMKVKKYGMMGLKGNQRLEPIFDFIIAMRGNYVIVENIVDGQRLLGVIRLIE